MASAGHQFREAIKKNDPLIIPGAINAYSAKLAEKAGHKAVYLSFCLLSLLITLYV